MGPPPPPQIWTYPYMPVSQGRTLFHEKKRREKFLNKLSKNTDKLCG